MDENKLIMELRDRAGDSRRRHDFSEKYDTHLPLAATQQLIAEVEDELSLEFPPLLRRLYMEIANGGFGPGYGILGVADGHCDYEGRTVVDVYHLFTLAPKTGEGEWPVRLLPICSWGCSIWSCIDCGTSHGTIATLDDNGDVTYTEHTFNSWLEDWCNGVSLWDRMFDFETISFINPFTGEKVKSRAPCRAKKIK